VADILLAEPPRPIPAALVREGREMSPVFAGQARELVPRIGRYRQHRFFGRAHLEQRIGALKAIARSRGLLFRHPCTNRPKVLRLGDRADSERAFLGKLRQHHQRKDSKVAELIEALTHCRNEPASWKKVGDDLVGYLGSPARS